MAAHTFACWCGMLELWGGSGGCGAGGLGGVLLLLLLLRRRAHERNLRSGLHSCLYIKCAVWPFARDTLHCAYAKKRRWGSLIPPNATWARCISAGDQSEQ